MDENQSIQRQEENNQTGEIKVNSKKSLLRTFVMVFLQISNIAFCVSMGYLFLSYLLNALGLNLSGFFGGTVSSLTLGISSTIGIVLYFILFVIGALIVGLAIAFVKINNEYYKILKSANDQKLEVVLAPHATTKSMINILVVLVVLVFLSITFVYNNMFSLPVIMLFVASIALLVAFVLAIVNIVINRVKYNKLPDDQKAIVQEQSKAFAKKEVKKERNKRVGKLY